MQVYKSGQLSVYRPCFNDIPSNLVKRGLLLIILAISLIIIIICWLKTLRKQRTTTQSVLNKFWVPEDEKYDNPLVGVGAGFGRTRPNSFENECKDDDEDDDLFSDILHTRDCLGTKEDSVVPVAIQTFSLVLLNPERVEIPRNDPGLTVISADYQKKEKVQTPLLVMTSFPQPWEFKQSSR